MNSPFYGHSFGKKLNDYFTILREELGKIIKHCLKKILSKIF